MEGGNITLSLAGTGDGGRETMTIIPRNVGVTTHFQVLEQDTGGAATLQAGALDSETRYTIIFIII